jgi:hypothetical protein
MSDQQDFEVGDYVRHARFGVGKVIDREDVADRVKWVIDFGGSGRQTFASGYEGIVPLSQEEIHKEELKQIVKEAIAEELAVEEVPLGDRWTGGQLVLKPASDTLQERAIPISTLFHKIVMLRERLRVLEQKINAHPKLSDEDKIDLQQYITRIYGTLTTFNLLFKNRADHFVGEGGRGN